MSGLQIFNAHPALYWGNVSTFDTPLMAMTVDRGRSAEGRDDGVRTTLRHDRRARLSTGPDGEPADRGFPRLGDPAERSGPHGRPKLALLLRLGLRPERPRLPRSTAWSADSFGSALIPSRDQIRHFGASVREHLTLRFPKGDEAKRYNVIQKLTYLVVLFVLLPVQVLAGLAMSPAMNAAFPFLLTLFGGRQSARTVHFVVAALLVLFVVVHVAAGRALGLLEQHARHGHRLVRDRAQGRACRRHGGDARMSRFRAAAPS